jgi:hypothetical protein
MEINGMENVGILFFHSFSKITIIPSFVASKELKAKIISDLLSSSAIVKDLNSANKEFYLQLYANTKFYLVDQLLQNFVNLGLFYNVSEEMLVYGPHINKFIEIDIIQQHFIRYGILETDIGSVVIANIPFGNFPFTSGIIDQIDD